MSLLLSIALAAEVCSESAEPTPHCVVGLQAAIDAAAPGEVLELRQGTFAESVLITKDLTIRPAAEAVVLVTGVLGPTFAVQDADLILEDLHATASGARVVQVTGSGSLTTTDVTLRGEQQLVLEGGVVWVENGSLRMVDTVVSRGAALLQGGLISVGGEVTLVDTDLRDGESQGDGGLLYATGPVTATGGTWERGVALSSGGALHAPAVELTDVAIRDNVAGNDGGGARITDEAILTNVEIASNSAGRDGGGLVANSLLGTELTVVHNLTEFTGGGLAATNLELSNSVVCDNHAWQGAGVTANDADIDASIITRNDATESGGGILAFRGELASVHVVANSATDGAAFSFNDYQGGGWNIISENRAGNGGNAYKAALSSGLFAPSTSLIWDNTGAISETVPAIVGDPQLTAWEDCSSLLFPGYWGAARDAIPQRTDPDGSPGDYGAFSTGTFHEEVWEDLDLDGVIDLYDCRPQNPTIFPEADDPPYDGTDQDCRDDDDFDADDDGHRPFEHGGLDCDDNNPEASPDFAEVLGNAVDEDCDGWAGVTAEIAPRGCNHLGPTAVFRWWRR